MIHSDIKSTPMVEFTRDPLSTAERCAETGCDRPARWSMTGWAGKRCWPHLLRLANEVAAGLAEDAAQHEYHQRHPWGLE